MLTFDSDQITDKEKYKMLIGSVIPRPIAFVTSVSEEGTINGAPFSYFNIVSAKPPLISIAVQRKDGVEKDTARNIKSKGEFVVHIVDEENVEKVNITAASLPPNESEVEMAKLTPVESKKVSVPGVKEAKVRYECQLEQVVELGEEDQITVDLIIGRVVQYHIAKDIYYQNGRINREGLAAVSRLAGQDYAKIGETFSLVRPK